MTTTPQDSEYPQEKTILDTLREELPAPENSLGPYQISANEAAVPLAFEDLAPHVMVVTPARPALTYERME